MKTRLLIPVLFLLSLMFAQADDGPIRVLFLGHPAKHHNSNEYYPMLAKALGRDAIYFDYNLDNKFDPQYEKIIEMVEGSWNKSWSALRWEPAKNERWWVV